MRVCASESISQILPRCCQSKDSKSKHLSVNACVLTTMLRYKLSKLYLDSTQATKANASSGFVCFFALFVFVCAAFQVLGLRSPRTSLDPSHLIGPC